MGLEEELSGQVGAQRGGSVMTWESSEGEWAGDHQVGGDHYRQLSPQPWDVIAAWRLGFFSGNVIKYVARHREKGGVEDLRKARHYLDKLIELQSVDELDGCE